MFIIQMFYHPSLPVSGVSELPFLDLGDDSRVPGAGKFFGVDDGSVQLNASELPSSLPFLFGTGSETSIYVNCNFCFEKH